MWPSSAPARRGRRQPFFWPDRATTLRCWTGRTFPAHKPCGEYLTPGAVGLLRDELGVLPSLLAQGAAWVDQERVVAHSGRDFTGPTSALACPRVVTDQALRDEAEKCGVRVVEGFAVRRILWEGSSVVGVEGSDAEGEADNHSGAGDGGGGRDTLTAGPRDGRGASPPALAAAGPGRALRRDACRGRLPAVTMHLPRDGSDACCGVGPVCGPGPDAQRQHRRPHAAKRL